MANSEFRNYGYIDRVLKDLGWNTKNPRNGGQVYFQGEFLNHDDLLSQSLNLQKPENIVLIPWEGGNFYWVIEAKSHHNNLEVALGEAQDYANIINKSGKNDYARFATGIAGTPDSTFLVRTSFWNGESWSEVSINNHSATGLLSCEQCQDILARNEPHTDQIDDDPFRFLKKQML